MPSVLRPSLTVGGLPGTGTSTLCRLLQDALGLPYTYAGQIFRDEAARRGMSLADFGRLCQQDPSVDKGLDAQQVELLRAGSLILEGRLSGWLAHANDVPALKVWVVCDDDERARRVTERDGGDVEHQRHAMLEREVSEADRYRRYYGVDLADHSFYDLVLDSTHLLPAQLAQRVIAAWRDHLAGPRP